MVKKESQQKRLAPIIHTYEWAPVGVDAHLFTPKERFDDALAERGQQRVGDAAHALLRSQAMSAVPQLGRLINLTQSGWRVARDEGTRLAAEGDAAAMPNLATYRKLIHWETIGRLGHLVEQLTGVFAAYEEYRAGRRDAIAPAFLYHGLDLMAELSSKRRRQLDYWENVVVVPSRDELLAAGLDAGEATVVRRAYRSSAMAMLELLHEISRYYTPKVHAVYQRYKHGYSLLDPAVSQLRLHRSVGDAAGTVLQREMRTGFAVGHLTDRAGPRPRRIVMHLVQSSDDLLEECFAATQKTLSLTGMIVGCWLSGVEHERGRTVGVADVDQPADRVAYLSGLRKWYGEGFGGGYDIDDALRVIQAGWSETDKDAGSGSGPNSVPAPR